MNIYTIIADLEVAINKIEDEDLNGIGAVGVLIELRDHWQDYADQDWDSER